MAEHAEEQEMESEALAAIFDTHFEILKNEQPFEWSISLYPEHHDPSSEGEDDVKNHVACKLLATLPTDYPENLPEIRVEIIKGLAEEHQVLLQKLAAEEAETNQGVPSIFAVAERIREWLAENNSKGLDDVSAYGQMMRKQKQQEEQQASQERRAQAFESQKQDAEYTAAELEEMAVRKRRAEGTPCTKENFVAWRDKFEAEMKELKERRAAAQAREEAGGGGGKKKQKDKKEEDKSGRLTGIAYFRDKGASNLEALEAAAEQAAEQNEEEEDDAAEALEDVDEDLFDQDVDLDDLDFDDDDEEDEELDI